MSPTDSMHPDVVKQNCFNRHAVVGETKKLKNYENSRNTLGIFSLVLSPLQLDVHVQQSVYKVQNPQHATSKNLTNVIQWLEINLYKFTSTSKLQNIELQF